MNAGKAISWPRRRAVMACRAAVRLAAAATSARGASPRSSRRGSGASATEPGGDRIQGLNGINSLGRGLADAMCQPRRRAGS